MTLLEAVQRFIECQRYVRKLLNDTYDIPWDIRAQDWAEMHYKIVQMHLRKPIGKVFYPHGYGIEYKDEQVNVDFDFCKTGRPDGFDTWRICNFCEQNKLDVGLSDFKEFGDALEALVQDGVIEREENLYFLTRIA